MEPLPDANGNPTGWVSDQGNTRRTVTWDEENRIQQIRDNGQLLTYKKIGVRSALDSC